MEIMILFGCAVLLLLEAVKGLGHPKRVNDTLPLGGSSISQIGIVFAAVIGVTQIVGLF